MAANVHVERNLARVVLGLAVITIGLLFTLDNLGYLQAETYLDYWPVVLVFVGVAHLAQSRAVSSVIWSVMLIVVGFWVLGENLGYIAISIWKLAPLLLVALGLSILWRSWAPAPDAAGAANRTGASDRPAVVGGSSMQTGVVDAEAYIRGTAVLGSFERTTSVADFRGADLVAIMGGCKLDLRKAIISGDQAVIDVTAIMGGIELRIPDNWSVDVRVSPFMGGVTDQKRRATTTPTQRLLLRGTVVMGGVEIKD